MTKEEILQTLKVLLPQVAEIDVALIGSANLLLQGIDIVPNDIDFITSSADIEKISEIFHSEINRENPYIKTEFMMGDIEIEFVATEGNPFRSPEYFTNKTVIEVGELKVPAITLEAEGKVYEMMGRDKDILKVGQIRDFLANK